jgi:hypothetical protein
MSLRPTPERRRCHSKLHRQAQGPARSAYPLLLPQAADLAELDRLAALLLQLLLGQLHCPCLLLLLVVRLVCLRRFQLDRTADLRHRHRQGYTAHLQQHQLHVHLLLLPAAWLRLAAALLAQPSRPHFLLLPSRNLRRTLRWFCWSLNPAAAMPQSQHQHQLHCRLAQPGYC